MTILMRGLSVLALMVLQLALAVPVAMVTTTALAAPGDFCFVSGTDPGVEDNSNVCQPSTPSEGTQCGNSGLFFNTTAATCVADNDSCTPSGGGTGFYTGGVCSAPPAPVTPT
jgi:hypothetical protein